MADLDLIGLPATSSIATRYNSCASSFTKLCALCAQPDFIFADQVAPSAVQDEFGRLRVWAGNIGAHRTGRVSLDYRLREASHMYQRVTELLDELNTTLKESIAIVSGDRNPYDDEFSDSDSSDSSSSDAESEPSINPQEQESLLKPTTELQQLAIDVNDIVSCLYKLSVAIRNPAPSDRLAKSALIDTSHFVLWDVKHIAEKYPTADPSLVQRLGEANSKRRQLLKYMEKHHSKLSRNIASLPQIEGPIKEPNVEPANIPKALQSTEVKPEDVQSQPATLKTAPSILATTVNTQTTVATFLEVEDDPELPDTQSETSSATSASTNDDGALHMPPPPKGAYDSEPFECPYCFDMMTIRGTTSWRKHVFRDLQPYMCTFTDCNRPNRMFGSRHAWRLHEIQTHRREWLCNACQQNFASKIDLENHMRKSHPGSFAEHQLSALIDMCERPIGNATLEKCPLCLQEGQLLKSHLARHMQTLALFTLPRKDSDSDEDMASIGAHVWESDEDADEDRMEGAGELDSGSDLSSEAQREAPDMVDEEGVSRVAPERKGRILLPYVARDDEEVTVDAGDEVVIVDPHKTEAVSGAGMRKVRRLKDGREGWIYASNIETTGVIGSAPSRSPGLGAGRSDQTFYQSVEGEDRLWHPSNEEEKRLEKEFMASIDRDTDPELYEALETSFREEQERQRRERNQQERAAKTNSMFDQLSKLDPESEEARVLEAKIQRAQEFERVEARDTGGPGEKNNAKIALDLKMNKNQEEEGRLEQEKAELDMILGAASKIESPSTAKAYDLLREEHEQDTVEIGEYLVFVENLPLDVNEFHLKSVFDEKFESCDSASVRRDPNAGPDRKTGRNFGVVRFSQESEQHRALTEMQGLYCGILPMRVSALPPKSYNVKARILVVSDARLSSNALEQRLKQEGMEDVTSVGTGQEVIDKVRKSMEDHNTYSVIFMDARRHHVGTQNTRRIREMGFSGPIVGLTTYGNEKECLSFGIDFCITNLAQIYQLQQALKKYCAPVDRAGEGDLLGVPPSAAKPVMEPDVDTRPQVSLLAEGNQQYDSLDEGAPATSTSSLPRDDPIPNFSPFPKLVKPPPNIPPDDDEKERTLETARVPILKTTDPEVQLVWADDALRWAEIAQSDAERLSKRPSTPRIEHQIRKDAIAIVEFLADQTHPRAMFMKGLWLEFGKFGYRMDRKEAFLHYRTAAEKGYARASYRMGIMYESSNDSGKAFEMYHNGVSASDAASLYRVGMMELLGDHGVSQDYEGGILLIRKSAEQADENAPQGAYVLGMLQINELPQVHVPDIYLPRSFTWGRQNIEKSAFLGFSKAQIRMGQAYELAQIDCEFNPTKSLHYYVLAARQGEPEAEMAISKWFLSGYEGVFEKNAAIAYEYAQRAASSDYALAQFAVGYYYEVGIHVSVNIPTARFWYEKAAAKGHKDAVERLNKLREIQGLEELERQNPQLYSQPGSEEALGQRQNTAPVPYTKPTYVQSPETQGIWRDPKDVPMRMPDLFSPTGSLPSNPAMLGRPTHQETLELDRQIIKTQAPFIRMPMPGSIPSTQLPVDNVMRRQQTYETNQRLGGQQEQRPGSLRSAQNIRGEAAPNLARPADTGYSAASHEETHAKPKKTIEEIVAETSEGKKKESKTLGRFRKLISRNRSPPPPAV